MKGLYSSPLRVYLCLGALALAGIFAGSRLPVSLFPNSTKPLVNVSLSYGNATASEVREMYGNQLENLLRSISKDGMEVESIQSTYSSDELDFNVIFKWGTPPMDALREVQTVTTAFSSRMPDEIRDSLHVGMNSENSGFFAASYYSETRSLDELYDYLDPILAPEIARVKDANDAVLFNPSAKEINVELDPAKLAALQLYPRHVADAIRTSLRAYNGGAITLGTKSLGVQMPRSAQGIEEMGGVPITTPSGKLIHLRDIAKIDFALKTRGSRTFKTSGATSLILFAMPKPGGNIKTMAEDLIQAMDKIAPSLPKDIQQKVLVDPSEFIRSSIHNVFHEVAIGAFLAVVILFVFIGSFKNTVTAAIEIPLSMILAFILMKFSNMNLNLISLGGLALSAGMNVDASVVVMENIFRHFEGIKGTIGFQKKLEIVTNAVKEVRFAVIASTIASLVVFLPLAFTSDLSYAVLGDLAKTVVFSHGLSMFVALILVPTVRLQLLSKAKKTEPHHSPFEKGIQVIESLYVRALASFLQSPRMRVGAYTGVIAVLVSLCLVVLPRLPREIIGKPDTDWMFLSINTKGNTLLKQMESSAEEWESKLLDQLGDEIQYTFTMVQGPNNANVLAKLKDKKHMRFVQERMEELFVNTPVYSFYIDSWNPAELPIPDPPHLKIAIRGKEEGDRAKVAQSIQDLLEEAKTFDRLWTKPSIDRSEGVVLTPHPDQWAALVASGAQILPSDLAEIARIGSVGQRIESMSVANRSTDILLRFDESWVHSPEDLASFPIGLRSKIIPLSALSRVSVGEVAATLYREDSRDLTLIQGKQDSKNGVNNKANALQKAKDLLAKFQPPTGISVSFEDAEKDFHEAMEELTFAVGLSVVLIFFTLVFQFGDLMSAVLVLTAIPLGLIGVLSSLFIFQSTLSLNSVLGVILLNGISVANSILLVDFLKRLTENGHSPVDAALEAARLRLRPILITSLTTILGMMPIAFGFGDGGRILQPLGISVSGGLWVSMALTLFLVPALQVAYLKRRAPKEFEPTLIATPPPFLPGLTKTDPATAHLCELAARIETR